MWGGVDSNVKKEYLWCALRIRSNSEKKVLEYLTRTRYEVYIPSYEVKRQWSDRLKLVTVPLFPGYAFCRVDPTHYLPVLQAPGVIEVIAAGGRILPVSERELAAVRQTLASGLEVSPWPYLKKGTVVRVEYGPLKGVEGYILRSEKRHRIVLSISLLQRSIAVELDGAWVRPLDRAWPQQIAVSK